MSMSLVEYLPAIPATEIWDRLEVTHEGTNQVKESKISILVHIYKLFKMESNESITGMYTRFTDIINNLKNFCKSYTDSELYRKVLRSLPRSWKAKVTAIQEVKDLTCLKLEELLGSLTTYELTLNQQEEEEMKKKKKIVLAAEIKEEAREESEDDRSDSEVVLLARRI